MSQSLDIAVSLGGSKTGLFLQAQIVDSSGTAVGSAVTGGFSEIGNGNYLWTYSGYADGFSGGVSFSTTGDPDTILAFTSLNPSDFGNSSGGSEISVTVGHSDPPQITFGVSD
jgi:hypothetical protein